jgi:hypothetical protein
LAAVLLVIEHGRHTRLPSDTRQSDCRHNSSVRQQLVPKRAGRLLHATGERLKEFGSILVAPERKSPEYLQKFIQSEIEKWAALIKAANIKAE